MEPGSSGRHRWRADRCRGGARSRCGPCGAMAAAGRRRPATHPGWIRMADRSAGGAPGGSTCPGGLGGTEDGDAPARCPGRQAQAVPLAERRGAWCRGIGGRPASAGARGAFGPPAGGRADRCQGRRQWTRLPDAWSCEAGAWVAIMAAWTRLAVGELWEVGGGRGGVAAQAGHQAGGGARVEHGLPGGERAHRGDEVGAADLLQHVSGRSGHDRVQQCLLVVEGGEDQAGELGHARAQLTADGHAVSVRQPHVEDRHVGA